VTLRIVARAADESFMFPEAGTAVVMQVDGRRTKCITLGLRKTLEGPGFAVFTSTFTAYGQSTHSGRVDISGQIYEFNVPLDGSTGTLAIATDQTPLPRNRSVIVVTATPTEAPAAAAPARDTGLKLPKQVTEPAFLLGALVIVVTVLGAYVDRRRSLARSLAA
jgi:hypothetical protein